MNIETASENVRTMDKFVKASSIPDKHNEESVDPEVLPKKINATDDMDAEASDNL